MKVNIINRVFEDLHGRYILFLSAFNCLIVVGIIISSSGSS